MNFRSEAFLLAAALLVGAMWLPAAAHGATVQAGFVLAQHVDYRARMEREAAGYVRAGHRALKRGQYKKARALFLKAQNLFPHHKGADAGLRRVRAAGIRARKRAAEAQRRRKAYLAKWGPGPRTITNSIGMKFVKVPAGSFVMGSPSTEMYRLSNEGPQHRVVISRPFYMQTTEVTQAQYRAIMGTNPSHFKGCDRCPVEQVSWQDAREFIRRLNAREGTPKYRLPTEAEWEYACRSGTQTLFNFGKTISPDRANYNGTYEYENARQGVYRRKTTAVGSFPPNRWGLYDMHGNVWEWCQDYYGQRYYRKSPTVDPRGPSSSNHRVARGGSWDFGAWYLRSAVRNWLSPSFRGNYLGFRVVRDL